MLVGHPKYGNRFVIGRDGTREEVIQRYIDWFTTQDHLITSIGELTGSDLICWCAPLKCHATFLNYGKIVTLLL